jgi:selenocysteine lyase/cysteine desulfurase
VAPTAVVYAAVRIGADARILFGAVLTAEDGVIRVGDGTVVMENAPREVAEYLAARRIYAWNGHNYAWELTESPGIRDSGSAVRVGLVRYNDPSDVDCLPGAVADLDGNRESCGDLPG